MKQTFFLWLPHAPNSTFKKSSPIFLMMNKLIQIILIIKEKQVILA